MSNQLSEFKQSKHLDECLKIKHQLINKMKAQNKSEGSVTGNVEDIRIEGGVITRPVLLFS